MLIMEILIWIGVLGFRGLWEKVQVDSRLSLYDQVLSSKMRVAWNCICLDSLVKQQPIKTTIIVADQSTLSFHCYCHIE
jgi:hypothetical protein